MKKQEQNIIITNEYFKLHSGKSIPCFKYKFKNSPANLAKAFDILFKETLKNENKNHLDN